MPDHIARRLLRWYRRHRRDLPWRRSPRPWSVWVSEVMLQQTRVETVVPYWRRFLARYPDPAALAAASEEEVLALWSGLGYYRRARALREGARAVVERFGGEFPHSFEDAVSLPGVGPYTAAAVLSIARGVPVPLVDGNVERVVARMRRVEGDPKRAAPARRIRATVEEWLDRDAPGEFNQALMELGATVCTPRRPACDRCPLEEACEARAEGDPERWPQAVPRSATVDVALEAGLLRRGGRWLLERPDELGFLRGLWVFPLAPAPGRAADGSHRGTPVPDAGIEAALERKLGVPVRARGELAPVRHAITYRKIRIRPVLLEAPGAATRGRPTFRWAGLAELGDAVPVSSMCLKIARTLARCVGEAAGPGAAS